MLQKMLLLQEMVPFPICTSNFLIHETDLHFNNSKCESGNPTGESFTTADTSKGLVDTTTPHWAVQELRPGMQPCEPASAEGLMVSTGQACQGMAWESRQHAAQLLLQFSLLSSSLLRALLSLAILSHGSCVS